VIDKGKLNRFAKLVAGLVVTAGPVMLAWGATSHVARDGSSSCRLSEAQEQALEAVATTFVLNDGCFVNVSLSIDQGGVTLH
jgi:hypothetical protein